MKLKFYFSLPVIDLVRLKTKKLKTLVYHSSQSRELFTGKEDGVPFATMPIVLLHVTRFKSVHGVTIGIVTLNTSSLPGAVKKLFL